MAVKAVGRRRRDRLPCRGRRARSWRRRSARCAPTVTGSSATRRSTWSGTSTTRARRDPGARRRPRQRRSSSASATAPCSGGTRSWSRRRPRRAWTAASRAGHGRRARARPRDAATRRRRHDRVAARRRASSLPRDEHPPAGGASRHRARHRDRPRAGAAPDRRRPGAGLPQEDVVLRGVAIECRINAEAAHRQFIPSPGTIARYREPVGPGVRVDSGVEEGTVVTPFYDSLLAKVVVWGESRGGGDGSDGRSSRRVRARRHPLPDSFPSPAARERAVAGGRDVPRPASATGTG